MNPLIEMLCPTCSVAQKFGDNATSVYQSGGLYGHPGWDIGCGYGTPILAPFDMYVYSVIGPQSPLLGPEGYTQVGGIVETELESFEWIIGHCEPTVSVGYVKKGEKIATEANHGPVWANGKQVTLSMQSQGDKSGSHRHYQKRPLIKVKKAGWGTYLNAYGYYKDTDGNYYQVYSPNNGYNGCVDWTLPLFNRPLGLLSTGYDVYLLQKALVKEGYATFTPTGYYGLLTYQAVKKYQTAHGFDPVGTVGPQTRQALNTSYKPLP